jgi:hypothetical protein
MPMKIALLFVSVLLWKISFAQPSFSLATSVSGLQNFTPKQKFFVVGQKIQGDVHFSGKESGYASLEYYTEGKFKNNFSASAKSSLLSPQRLPFTATGRISVRQFSLGWKHYFKGGFSEQAGTTFYGLAGFGYLFASIRNSASPSFDTGSYTSPIIMGQGKVKRLTFDAGIGAETRLGGGVYAFADVRSWLPLSYTPSRYLHSSNRMPLTLMAGAGIRFLFDFTY